MYTLNVNGNTHQVDVPGTTPLLWVLRDHLGLTGTKYGCGVELCSACLVIVDGEPEKACHFEVKEAVGRRVMTIEATHPLLAKIRQAWVDLQVPQCGYCQSGMIIAAFNLLREHHNPTDAQIDGAMRNLCVCGTYQRVRQAIHAVAAAA